jgi:hypothetical protein
LEAKQDEDLKKKVALYYHSLVLLIVVNEEFSFKGVWDNGLY